MKLKTYFSGTVEAAMELASKDLGPDTMIVYSRKASQENRHLGEYEVVFAIDENPEAAVASPVVSRELPLPAPTPGPPAPPDVYGQFAAEVADLRRQMEQITGAITRASVFGQAQSPELAGGLQSLLDDGLDSTLAQEILDEAQSRRGPSRDRGALNHAIDETLLHRLQISEGRGTGENRVLALVGPPGTGKTLTLIKLAVTLGLARRRSVQIISADTVKIGAPEQLRTYAAILGIPFQFVETPSALERAVEENGGRKLILIDTPGYSPREMGEARPLAAAVSQIPDVEVHLVLSATTKDADLLRAVESYRVFGTNRLLFTRLDETASYGSILNTAIRSGLPVSYLSTGQSVPEDIEPASAGTLLDRMRGGIPEAASAA